jgi:transposase-like protein
MSVDLTNPIFTNEDKAREHLEALRWPDGPFCPHCGSTNVHRLKGKSHRPGLFQCNDCAQAFTVMVGSVMERSHIPLTKWVLAFYLMNSSKKGISAHQLHRMLGVTYKTAWFLARRVREAMKATNPSPLGGEGKTVEVDETAVGGKAKNRAYAKKPPTKQIVVSLVERGGAVRSFHAGAGKRVTSKTLRPLIVKTASRKSRLMTDEDKNYVRIGEEFASHDTVNHWKNEYARGDACTNTVEGFFSIFKRGVIGVYHHVSEAPSDTISRRIRFQIFKPRQAWRERWRTCGARHQRRRGQASHVSAC